MDGVQKLSSARFRFLDEEQFKALTAREKLAYLVAAISELQRLTDESPSTGPPRPPGAKMN